MFILRHAIRLIAREPRRSLAVGAGVVLAAALMSTVLLFGSASGSTLTRRALSNVKVDAQAVVANGTDPQTAATQIRRDPAVTAALPFDVVHFDTAALNKAGSATQTSVGALVGIDPDYTQRTGLFSVSQGAQTPGQVTISRDLATNIGAIPGDKATFVLPGGAKVDFTISGIVSIAGADLILGPTDASHRAVGANPPTNVAVIDRATLDQQILPKVPAGTLAKDPAAGQAPSGNSPVSNSISAVERQVHMQYDLTQVPGDPVAAQLWLDQVRRRIERDAVGAFTVVDDASASLEPVAGDLLWGQVLFLFLALPGIALAVAVSRLAADATSDATRRHLALLRARGATRSQLIRILLAATVGISFLASLIGALIGAAVAWLRFGAELASVEPASSTVRAILISVVVVTVLGAVAAALVLRDQLREEVAAGRQELQRTKAPLWQRLYLDIAAIVAAVVVFVVTGGTNLKPIFTTEGNPTVTLALTAFVAPFLFWTGTTLLLLRLALYWLRRGSGLRRALERMFGGSGVVAAGSLSARAAAVARAVVVLSLSVSLATSVLVFDATYRQQQRVDAGLTLGADLKLTPTQAIDASSVQQVAGSEISAATPFVDRVVYVGAEAQDMLAIDPNVLPQISPISDTFFDHQSAASAMDALKMQPDAVLVSAETAHDYSIVPGDSLNIRVPDANGAPRVVTFHMAGIALEFPTAPKDAFLVANQSYVAQQTGNNRISFVLASASGDPAGAAASLQNRLGPTWAVDSLSNVTARLANGITSVDLGALVQIELAFAVLIAALGTALFLLAALAERRRELATLEAIGAEPSQLRRAITAETAVIGLTGLLSGLFVGGLLGFAFLQILAGVFDPPAQYPVIPFVALLAVIVAVIAALVAATLLAGRAVARLQVVAALRER